VITVASNEFVDLDDIVPGTGFSKKDDAVKKKETPAPQKEAPVPAVEVYSQDEPEEEQTPAPKKEEKKPEKRQSGALPISDKSEKKPTEKKISEKLAEEETEIISLKEIKSESKQNVKKETAPVKEQAKPVHVSKPKIAEAKKQLQKQEAAKLAAKAAVIAKAAPKHEVKKPVVFKKQEKKIVKSVSLKKEKVPKKTNGKETNWTLIALLILAAIIVGVVIYMAVNNKFVKSTNEESIAAVVNGQPIYNSELTNRFNLLKSTMNPFITQEQVLNLTISDKLLLQEAAKKGITTSNEEVSNLINSVMLQNNISAEQLKADLASKNVSYDFLVTMYKNTLTINKLINSSFTNVTATDAELQTFYDENKDSLKIPDMVQVRHILFLFGNESEQATYDRAEAVFNMIKPDKSNFCELGAKYNEDTGSNDFCGEYNFSMNYPFVPEFLDAGFAMKIGEIKIIKTQLGYHIMYKIANLPGYVPTLNAIKDKLEPILIKEKTVNELNLMIKNLQSEAIIEIYTTNTTSNFNEINIATGAVPAVNADTEIPAVQENNSTITLPVDGNVVEAPAQVEITKEVVNTPQSQKMLLANCLNDKGVRMFTASWSPDSKDQLALFEDYATSLKIVECDPEAANADLPLCASTLKKQYPTWPTWQIGDKLYEGIQSLSALAKYSGCTY
jgi:parvulin-like peptidyl-prolyl isomerase